MSVLAPPRVVGLAEVPPPPPGRPLPSPAQARRRALWLGVGFVLLVLGSVVAILQSFGGAFSSYVVVQAELPSSATALALGAPVEYRNVTVGSVASQGRAAGAGLVVLTLHLRPSSLAAIPAAVRATETPVSFFGDPYLVLSPPASGASSGSRLVAGATIPPLTSGATASLQSTLGDLDALLTGLHPAELDAALTALAGALQGQGTSLGHSLDHANTYLARMLPLWPTVVSDLRTLVPVSGQLAASAQDILAILANQTVTASTISGRAASVRAAIGGGAALAAETAQLLSEIREPYRVLAADAGSFLQAASSGPGGIPRLLAGLDAWAKAWTAAESSGPSLDLSTDVVVANPADLGLAVLGGPSVVQDLSSGLGHGYVNPPTYSGAATIASAVASLSPVLGAPAETAAVSQIVQGMTGRAPAAPSVATLLLSPLLTRLVVSR
jgi:virulence factor Mce-like protein